MASALRLLSRTRRVPSVIQNFAAVTCSRTLVIPSVLKRSSREKILAFNVRQNFLKPQIRFMSADPDCIEEVQERVMHILCCFDKINPDLLTLGSHFMKDLGLDSLDHVEIIVAVENDFAFEIPDSKAELLLTPQEIIDYLCDEFDVAD